MKYFTFIFIIILTSNVSKAQSETNFKKDSSMFFLSPFHLYSSELPMIFAKYPITYSTENKRFTLYYDSEHTIQTQVFLYDNYKHKYFYNEALYPYHNFESALLCGSLNYLIWLIEKSK